MGGNCILRFEENKKFEDSKEIKEAAKGSRKNVFVRVRKMSLRDIMASVLARKGLTAAMEIRQYIKASGIENISKQAWLRARQKLNPEVFRIRNDFYMGNFYKSEDEVRLWNGYLVLAIDGSKAEIPNSYQNRRVYGTQGNDSCEGLARALVRGLFDVLNDFSLDLQICNVNKSEMKAAEENIRAIERIGLRQKVLVIFDRGYPSLELLNYLDEHGIAYIIRLSSVIYKKERGQVSSKDCAIKIMHTDARLRRLMESNKELYQRIKAKKCVNTRLVTDKTPSGEEFAVFTSLPEDITADEIVGAYFFRWKIEEAYGTLKNKMKFESVTGMASIYVEQDFLAQVYIYNMIEDVRHSAEEKVRSRPDKYKYPQRVNQNMAIGIFKDELINLLLEDDDEVRAELLGNLQAEISKYTLPVRKKSLGKEVSTKPINQ